MQEFGILRPVVLNIRTGAVLDGDRMLSALRDKDPEQNVPVWCVDLPEEQEDAAHLALNNHCGEWQWQPVSDLLKAIQARGQDLALTGFHDYDTGPLVAADWTQPHILEAQGHDPKQVALL